MTRFIIVILLILSFSSCKVGAPEFRGSEGIKMEKLEGKVVTFSVAAKVYNPNWFGVKIKRSGVDVYMDEKYMGKLFLEQKVKLKSKRESTLTVPLRAELEDGAMMTLLKNSSKENVNVRVTGKVKGEVFIFSKKIEINETRQIPGKMLRPGGINLGN